METKTTNENHIQQRDAETPTNISLGGEICEFGGAFEIFSELLPEPGDILLDSWLQQNWSQCHFGYLDLSRIRISVGNHRTEDEAGKSQIIPSPTEREKAEDNTVIWLYGSLFLSGNLYCKSKKHADLLSQLSRFGAFADHLNNTIDIIHDYHGTGIYDYYELYDRFGPRHYGLDEDEYQYFRGLLSESIESWQINRIDTAELDFEYL